MVIVMVSFPRLCDVYRPALGGCGRLRIGGRLRRRSCHRGIRGRLRGRRLCGGIGGRLLGRLSFGCFRVCIHQGVCSGLRRQRCDRGLFCVLGGRGRRGFLFMLNVNIYRLLAVCQREVLRRGRGRFGHAAVGKRVDADGANRDGGQRPKLPLFVERFFPGVIFGQEDHPRKEWKASC